MTKADLDTVNNEFYNAYSEHFDKIPFEDVLIPILIKYLPSKVTSQQNVLEIGSGAGLLALWIKNLGFHVLCVEPAEKAAEQARQKGLDVSVCRFQDCHFDQKFHVILAISSLIHIPKIGLPSQVKKMSGMLHVGGYVVLSLLEGKNEGFEDPTEKGKMRYFSKLSKAEMDSMLQSDFRILESHQIEVKKMKQTFQLMVLQRRG